ncbi:MAG: hypothetical protein NVSMB47_15080 [Polyangiales bacterium]
MNKWRDLGDVGAVGIELVVSIALCYWAGHWADARWFHASGWVTFAGFALGVFVGFKAIFDGAARATRRVAIIEREEAEERAALVRERELRRRHARGSSTDGR